MTISVFMLTLSFTGFLTSLNGNAYVMAPSISTDLSSSGKNPSQTTTSTVELIARKDVTIPISNSAQTQTQKQTNQPGVVVTKPDWVSAPLFVDTNNTASAYAGLNPTLANISYVARMGQQPVAHWFGDWDVNITASVGSYVSAASAVGAVPVLVFYNIPNRDCGGYSAGSLLTNASYLQWVSQAAAGLAGRKSVIILEPDAIAGAGCLPATGEQERYQTIAQAVTIIKSQPNAYVYLDAGNPTWQSATTMASRLKAANIATADGFSLNVSNFSSTNKNRLYGDQLSSLVGDKHYVIDTSRSGGNNIVTGALYNPSFAALGDTPTTQTANSRNDALLWIKIPWESDGPVNDGPAAGQPYWSYAIQVAQNAGW